MRSVAYALALLGFVACSTPAQNAGPAASSLTTSQLALGAMRTRDYKVTWLAGGRLRVENTRGDVLANEVTIEDVARIDPFLRNACTNAKAAGYLDAALARTALDSAR